MAKNTTYNWQWYLKNMSQCANTYSVEANELLDLLKYCDDIIGRIISREMSFFSNRPQDYLASILTVNSFRIAISGLYISSSGYWDVSPILNRTLWETGIRLFHIQSDPVKLSLAFCLHSRWNEIKAVSTEIEFRNSNSIDMEYFESSLELLNRSYNKMSIHASKLGYIGEKIQKEYSNTTLKDICKYLGAAMEKAYKVDYVDACGYAHGAVNSEFLSFDVFSGKLNFNLGPIDSRECKASISDIFTNLIRVIFAASEIIDDSNIIDITYKLSCDARRLMDNIDWRPEGPLSKP